MRVVDRLLVLTGVLALASCSDRESVRSRTVALNNTPQIGDFAVYARNSLVLRPAASVSAGDIGVKDVATTMLHSGKELAFEGASTVQTTHNALGNRVFLDTGAVLGDVHTTALTDFGATHGAVAGMPTMPALPTPASVTAGTTNLTVAAGTTTTLSGSTSRAAVTLNDSAILRLAAGTYQFASLKLLANARVEAQGPVEILMTGRLTAGTNVYFGPASGVTLTAAGLRIEVNGVNGGSGGVNATPRAALIDDDGVLRALLLVPNGTTFIGQRTAITGAIAGRDIDLRENANVTREDGFGTATCVPADCNDSNVCTTDACGGAGCTHTPVATGTSCADGTVCNGAETCNASGACVAGAPPVVDDSNVCTADSCDPVTGVAHTPVAAGTSCADSTVCNGAETCNASGTCQSGSPLTVDDGNPCTADSCDPVTGVAHTPVAAGTSCADGTVCNGAETCNASATCVSGTPPVVDDGNVCTADSCDPVTGVAHTPVAAGTSCADSTVCNGAETCNAGGTCEAGTPPTIDDGNVCTADSCDPVTGVAHAPVAAGTSCADGTVCNGAEVCNASGTCNAGTPPAVDDGNACTADSCDAITGVAHTPVAAGASCADGTVCNGAETCNASGTCLAGTPPAVDDANACTADSCDPVTGVAHTPMAVGTSCADSTVCNGAETCNASGICEAGPPPALDDSNVCTADSCDPVSGVAHAPVATGTSCADGTVCNGAETCNASGSCTSGTPPATDDNNACTADSCDPVTGVAHTPVAAGTFCTDGDSGNGPEICNAIGSCVSYAPEIVAPPVNMSVVSFPPDTTAFIYSGPNPIQTGVAPGTIERERAAILRGRVLLRDGSPLAAVTLTAKDHPEFGATVTRADGRYDFVVNGGGLLTLRFDRVGYLRVQREIETPWADFVDVADVVLTPYDAAVTEVTSGAPTAQVAVGSVVTDDEGPRQPRIIFAPGTTATMTGPAWGPLPLSTFHVRATEFTVGPDGPKAMPADLPPESLYTYAAAYTLDEAVAMGATRVDFSQPVIAYTPNFLEFRVGTAVPSGYLDPERGVWVASTNGLVVKVIAINAGLADLDTDGDGSAEGAATYTALGITNDERASVAAFATAGTSFWRVTHDHFTAVDYNDSSGGTPVGAQYTAPVESLLDTRADAEVRPNSCKAHGSIIRCEQQGLGETLMLSGAPFALTYTSDRQTGRVDDDTLDIGLTDAAPPSTLIRGSVVVSVAGQVTQHDFGPGANQTYRYTWNGLDRFGRRVQGTQTAFITVWHTYIPPYSLFSGRDINSTAPIFGRLPPEANVIGIIYGGNRVYPTLTVIQQRTAEVGGWLSEGLGLGGWGIDALHAYDYRAQRVYSGDGDERSAGVVGSEVVTVAGTGVDAPAPIGPAGGPALTINLRSPGRMVAAPDGAVVFVDTDGARVWRLTRAGLLETVAGTGSPGFSGDNGPASSAQVKQPGGVAIGPDGAIYIADTGNHRIRRVSPSGTITTIAGTGVVPNTQAQLGEGGPATAAAVFAPDDVAVGLGGSVFIIGPDLNGTSFGHIRRIGTDGLITTIIKNIAIGGGMDTDAQGNIYFAEAGVHRVRRIKPDGTVQHIVGMPTAGWGGLLAPVFSPVDVVVENESSILVVERSIFGGSRVMRVEPGKATVMTGTGAAGGVTEFSPASVATYNQPGGVAVDPRGNILVADAGNRRVRRLRSTLPTLNGSANLLVAAADGSEVYEFDPQGRHLRTVDPNTKVTLLTFAYDSAGRLASITDLDGDITTFARGSGGQPSAIVGPYGEETSLTVAPSGFLATVTNANDEQVVLDHYPGGLLHTLTDPRGGVYTMQYDVLGRLIHDSDPAGGFKHLTQTDDREITVATAEGRTKVISWAVASNGGRTRQFTGSNGLVTRLNTDRAGGSVSTSPTGVQITTSVSPDPQWHMVAPVATQTITSMPSGKTMTTGATRSVTLADPQNPLSLESSLDTVTVNGKTATGSWNATTRTVVATSPLGRQASAVLDTQGRVTHQEVPGVLPVDTTYDARGRVETVVQGTRTLTITHDSAGRVRTIVDPAARTTLLERDAVGRVTTATTPGPRVTLLDHDENGNVTSITPPGRPEHTFGYSPVNFMSTEVAPDLGSGPAVTQNTYNLDLQLTQVTRPDGALINLFYDSAGRLDHVTRPEGTTQYAYHATTGHRVSEAGPGGSSITYAFDGELLTSATWSGPVAASVQFGHDNFFRVTSRTVGGTSAVTVHHDDDGLVDIVGEMTLARDPQNGFLTGSTLAQVTETISYSPYGELASTSATAAATPIHGRVYTRDSLGRVSDVQETVAGVTVSFHYDYDLAGHLTDVTRNGVLTHHYGYDANGNRTSQTIPSGSATANYDDRDRLLALGGTVYTYTANGEISTRNEPMVGVTQLRYDSLGRLVGATLPDARVIDYVLDPAGRRIGKKVNGVLVQGFVYGERITPVAELDGAGNVVAVFVYATGRTSPDYIIRGATKYRVLADHVGTPRLVVDTATGAVVAQLEHDVFGNVVADSNPGFQPFGFAGGVLDPDTGLVHMGAREYDPASGRFTSVDPLSFGGGDSNLYAYVAGDPVNNVDPSGLDAVAAMAEAIAEQHGQAAADAWLAGDVDVSVPWWVRLPMAPGGYALSVAAGWLWADSTDPEDPPCDGTQEPEYGLTGTNAGKTDRPYMNSPLTIREIMNTGPGRPDPGSKGRPPVPTALRWDVPGAFNTSLRGIWELVYDLKNNKVLHFLYRTFK